MRKIMGTKLRELVALLVFHQQLNKRNLRVRQEIQLNNNSIETKNF